MIVHTAFFENPTRNFIYIPGHKDQLFRFRTGVQGWDIHLINYIAFLNIDTPLVSGCGIWEIGSRLGSWWQMESGGDRGVGRPADQTRPCPTKRRSPQKTALPERHAQKKETSKGVSKIGTAPGSPRRGAASARSISRRSATPRTSGPPSLRTEPRRPGPVLNPLLPFRPFLSTFCVFLVTPP